MSVSWARIMPNGFGEINSESIDFYHRVFDELIKHGIEPIVTINHFDMPTFLTDNYNS